MIRVVLADGMALVRNGIRLLLTTAGDFAVLGEGETADDAVQLAAALRPDIMLLDRDIKGALGAMRAIREAVPGCDIVVLTNRFVQPDALRAAEEGASGYICKDVPGDVLLTTLRAIRVQGALRPVVASRGTPAPAVLHPASRRYAVPPNGLTARERDIIAELATGSTDTEIALKLHVHAGTVKTHIRHILRKLGVRNRTAAIAQALRERLID